MVVLLSWRNIGISAALGKVFCRPPDLQTSSVSAFIFVFGALLCFKLGFALVRFEAVGYARQGEGAILTDHPLVLPMQTGLTDSVSWAAVLGVTASIALVVILLVHNKAPRTVSCRQDSIQYVFTAAVQTRVPRVTYLDFPAPPPPSQDVVHEPTVLRTFERTLMKLGFRYVA